MKYKRDVPLRDFLDLDLQFKKPQYKNTLSLPEIYTFLGNYKDINCFRSLNATKINFLVIKENGDSNRIRCDWYATHAHPESLMCRTGNFNEIFYLLKQENKIEQCSFRRKEWPRVGINWEGRVFITPLIYEEEREELEKIVTDASSLKGPKFIFKYINHEIERRM